MKKKSLAITACLLAMGLASCGGNASSQKVVSSGEKEPFSTSALPLKVACPSGAPAVSLFAHLGESNVEINAAETVQGYMSDNANKDLVILPTNYGIKQIVTQNVNFKLAATVTFGNFFLLATGTDTDHTISDGDKVLAFQQNGVAGKLFAYVYDGIDLDVTYKGSAANVKDEVLAPSEPFDYDYVLLAQPVVKAVLGQKSEYSVYANIQEAYREKSGGKEITQASVFVKGTADPSEAKAALDIIKSDVEALLDDPSLVESQTASLENQFVAGKLGGTPQVIKSLLVDGNQLGIGYKDAYTNKDNIDAFIGTLGMGATSEEIYFRPEI